MGRVDRKLKALGYTTKTKPGRFEETPDEMEDYKGKKLDLPEKFFPKPHGYKPKKKQPQ